MCVNQAMQNNTPTFRLVHAVKRIPFMVYIQLMLIASAALSAVILSKQQVSYAINGMHTAYSDYAARYLTHAGDGVFAAILSLLWLFRNKKEALYIFCSYGASALITQILKHQVFNDALRPVMSLDSSKLHFVVGVEVHSYFSFPSGHATTAMALATALYFCIPARFHAGVCMVACVAALTRVYLLQHFITDVAAGAAIGCATALVLQLTLFHDRKISSH